MEKALSSTLMVREKRRMLFLEEESLVQISYYSWILSFPDNEVFKEKNPLLMVSNILPGLCQMLTKLNFPNEDVSEYLAKHYCALFPTLSYGVLNPTVCYNRYSSFWFINSELGFKEILCFASGTQQANRINLRCSVPNLVHFSLLETN